MAKKINGIPFDVEDMQQWRKQYTKDEFYARARSIYWTNFDAETQSKCIDELWAMGAIEDKPKVEKAK